MSNAKELVTILNSKPLEYIKYYDVPNGEYTITKIESLLCNSKMGHEFRSIRIILDDTYATFLPNHLVRTIDEGDIDRLTQYRLSLKMENGQASFSITEDFSNVYCPPTSKRSRFFDQ
jgi:hypothetical protein